MQTFSLVSFLAKVHFKLFVKVVLVNNKKRISTEQPCADPHYRRSLLMGSERAPGTNEIDRKMWQKARAGVTARTRGGGRASRAKLIG